MAFKSTRQLPLCCSRALYHRFFFMPRKGKR